MHVVCSFCRKDMGTKPPLSDTGLTHGMCPACGEYFGAQWAGMTYGAYLDRFPYPVVLLDDQARVVAVNGRAGAYLGRAPAEVRGLLGGEALECVHARLPEGCGKTVHCPTCAIRNAVTRTHRTGIAMHQVPATLHRGGGTVDLLVSTALEGALVRVILEPRQHG